MVCVIPQKDKTYDIIFSHVFVLIFVITVYALNESKMGYISTDLVKLSIRYEIDKKIKLVETQ